MSLTREQKLLLRQIVIFAYAKHERDGNPYFKENGKEKDFVIPTFPEIFEKMKTRIINCGFEKIERCEPAKANCIIRVYQKLHYEYDWGEIYNFYGADCYTKITDYWESFDGIDTYPIRYDSHPFSMTIGPDETLHIYDSDFVDYPVKIS